MHILAALALSFPSSTTNGGTAAPAATCTLETQKLVASGVAKGDQYGTSVSIDRDVLAVGAPGWIGISTTPGRGSVFERAGGDWVETASLQASDGVALDYFGQSVSVSGDTLVVGAWGNDHLDPTDPNCDCGAAYVFQRDASGWHETQRLTASDAVPGDFFGQAVALSGDTLVVGAPEDDPFGIHDGSVYVFERGPSGWVETQKLISDSPWLGRFGSTLAIDGDTLAVGATGIGTFGTEGVCVFERGPSGFEQRARFHSSDWQFDDEFGSVALSRDVLVVGAAQDDAACPATILCQSGAAYVFERTNGVWSERAKLLAPLPKANDFFGQRVAVEGGVIAVSAPGLGTNAGRACVFRRDAAGAWNFEKELKGAGSTVTDHFGWSVALSRGVLAVGAVTDDAVVQGGGACHTFVRAVPPVAYCVAKVNSLGCTPAIAWSGAPSASAGAGFVVSVADVLNRSPGFFFYGVDGATARPFQGGTLCVARPLHHTALQDSGGSPTLYDCSGTLALDFNARISAGVDPVLVAGRSVDGQFWSRDRGFAPPNDASLSNAIHFTICP
jgi:hypothetical protein